MLVFSALAVTGSGCKKKRGANASKTRSASKRARAAKPVRTDYVIVASDKLVKSATRFKQLREELGHRVDLLLVKRDIAPKGGKAEEVAQAIKLAVKARYAKRHQRRPFYLLLVGSGGVGDLPNGRHSFPGVGRDIHSDQAYSDMDGDELPDIAVGRISASADAEVDRVREKVGRHETTYRVGLWNRQIHLVASAGGFGAFVDGLMETLAEKLIEKLSYDYDVTMTYASPRSRAYYPVRGLGHKLIGYLNRGSLVTVYMGHAGCASLATMTDNRKWITLVDSTELAARLTAPRRTPLVLLSASGAGRLEGSPCLARSMVLGAHGPAAVIAATGITHPYPNAILIREWSELLTSRKATTAGELLRLSKRRMIAHTDKMRKYLDGLAAMVLKVGDRKLRKRTHLYRYSLFGDPALRLRYPPRVKAIKLEPAAPKTGGSVAVSITLPGLYAGRARVTLETQRRVFYRRPLAVPAAGHPSRQIIQGKNHARANDKVVVARDVSFKFGVVKTTLEVPPLVRPGTYYIKVYAEDGKADAVGHRRIEVE